MKYILHILRRKSGKEKPYTDSFEYETELENATVAAALTEINERQPLVNTDGEESQPIRWECSCLQKKCGACAMVICGRPMLACDARLSQFRKRDITVEPLRKFPTVSDLISDRTVLFENLKAMNIWLTGKAVQSEKKSGLLYDSSRCLQCGCCLEVCPNFIPDNDFFGMAAMSPAARFLEEMSKKDGKNLSDLYRKHIYNGCGKSLSCRNICPAGLDIEELLVNSNAVSVWKMKK